MYLLDTDHLSVLERGGAIAARLRMRLEQVPAHEVAVSIISYEEQTRGWLRYVARARTDEEQREAYGYVQQHLLLFCRIPLVVYDQRAITHVQQLRQQRLRMGTMDMKIAGIALAHQAVLLSRNVVDFQHVPGLRVEDWTVERT